MISKSDKPKARLVPLGDVHPKREPGKGRGQWEIAIKTALGRLRTTRRVDDPVALHHRDPFDRMLVAQAQDEGLTLVTRDPAMRLYDVRLLEC